MACGREEERAGAEVPASAGWRLPGGSHARSGMRAFSRRPLASKRLDRALGKQLRDGATLYADLDVRRDLDGRILVVQLGNLADDAAGRDHFIALLQRGEH